MSIPLSYATLKILWWGLLGILLMGFAITEGFDFGVLLLMPLIANSDADRRVLINTIGPVWEGNQVWLVLGAGAVFAAWPMLYVVSFQAFYAALMLALLALIIRPVAIKYRSKVSDARWRHTWDILLVTSAFIVPFILGVALGNVLQGIPFDFDTDLRMVYMGSFWTALNPFALGVGLLAVFLFAMQGAAYLQIKTNHPLKQKAAYWGRLAAWACLILYVILGLALLSLPGYYVDTAMTGEEYSNPLFKSVISRKGFWLAHYVKTPTLIGLPFFTVIFSLLYQKMLKGSYRYGPLLCSSSVCVGLLLTFGCTMFPFLLPSSLHPDVNLTVWDSASSQLTLFVMLLAALFFIPIILAYTSWVYYVLRGPVTKASLKNNINAY